MSETESAPPPKRADARRSQERLLTAAAELLDREPTASVDAIAAYAGVGRTTAFRHFATRDALISATWAHMLAEVDGQLADLLLQDRDPAEALDRLIEALVALAERWPLLSRGQRPSLHDPALTTAFSGIDTLVASTLRRATDVGVLRRDLPIEVLSETLPAIVQAVFIAGLRGRSASGTVTTLLLEGAGPVVQGPRGLHR